MIRKISLLLQVILYVVGGINHFIHPGFYSTIIPDYLPRHSILVAVSGIVEITLGLILIPQYTRKWAAVVIVLMLIVFLPVHFYMLNQSMLSDSYMIMPYMAMIRLVLQPLLIIWVLWSSEIIGGTGRTGNNRTWNN